MKNTRYCAELSTMFQHGVEYVHDLGNAAKMQHISRLLLNVSARSEKKRNPDFSGEVRTFCHDNKYYQTKKRGEKP